MIRNGKNKPEVVSIGICIRKFFYVNIEPRQISESEWEWESIALEPGGMNREEAIDKLVNLKYPSSKIMDITSNYLFNPESPEARFDYEAFQGWKLRAEEIADSALKYIKDNNINID